MRIICWFLGHHWDAEYIKGGTPVLVCSRCGARGVFR